ncbi:MAG: endo alpha-1,4 polygalactosaminidase [Micromonosporaceae bacterium]
MSGLARRTGGGLLAGLTVVVAVSVLSGASDRPRAPSTARPRPAAAVSPTPPTTVVLDAFRTDAQTVATLRTQGHRPLCRLNAGGWEPARPDAARFDPRVIGRRTGDPDGSRWLDVRRWDLLAPILASRLDLCRGKGFDAVVVDHVDGYAHPTGFPIALADQRRFTDGLAGLAHARGLRIGGMAPVPDSYDFTVTGPAATPRRTSAVVGSAGRSTTSGS